MGLLRVFEQRGVESCVLLEHVLCFLDLLLEVGLGRFFNHIDHISQFLLVVFDLSIPLGQLSLALISKLLELKSQSPELVVLGVERANLSFLHLDGLLQGSYLFVLFIQFTKLANHLVLHLGVLLFQDLCEL